MKLADMEDGIASSDTIPGGADAAAGMLIGRDTGARVFDDPATCVGPDAHQNGPPCLVPRVRALDSVNAEVTGPSQHDPQ